MKKKLIELVVEKSARSLVESPLVASVAPSLLILTKC